MVLTHENYHSPENVCITNSKAGDFMKSKEFYKAKHIDRTIADEPSSSMLVGSISDAIFSGLDHKKLYTKDKAYAKEFPDAITYVQPSHYDKGVEIGEFIVRQEFYKWYAGKKTVFQKPLSGRISREVDGKNISVPIAAMPDALTYVDDDPETATVFIDDLKTTRNYDMASVENWYRKCVTSGYFRQFAIMGQLAADKYKMARRMVFRHIVIGTTKDGTWKAKLFIIPHQLLEAPWREFVGTAFAIAMETEWKDPEISWESAVDIPSAGWGHVKPMPDEDGFVEV